MLLLMLLMSIALIGVTIADLTLDQLSNYKMKTCGSVRIKTTSNGAPVQDCDTRVLNSPLISNEFFMETQSHLDRQRIPERVVHAKGAGAFGYFEVTHNVTDICKAKLFSKIGKKTPVVVRFSQTSSDKGGADTFFDGRGFAVKFFTEEGNFDLLGLSTPMFTIKDPNIFQPLIRVIKRNPVTNLGDAKMLWDFITLHPESVFFFMYLFADNGTPDGYRYMPCFSIHTYHIYNKCGESYFVRFHILPNLGIRNLAAKEAIKLAGLDPDYAVRDLYNAIEMGDFPSWSVSVQVLSYEEVKKAKFDVFDVTKILSTYKYPLRPLGNLVLNKNPKNYFADVEQLAYCPGNLVPGILGGPDQLFLARTFAYRDAQFYRLGVNFNKIRVNCPLRNVFTYDRDGVPPVGYNGDDAPNYFPNSYHGPTPYVDKSRPTLLRVTHDESLNFDQAANFYTNELSKEQRNGMIVNIVLSLGNADCHVQKKAIDIFTEIHSDLGRRIAAGLGSFCHVTSN